MIDYATPYEELWELLKQKIGDVPRLVSIAYVIAQSAHEGQKRTEGTPYIGHPLRVCHILCGERPFLDHHMIAAGLLHDAVEDTRRAPHPVTIHFIKTTCNKEVALWVDLLTKPPVGKTAGRKKTTSLPQSIFDRDREYYARLMSAPFKVRLIKMADRLDNMRCLHLTGNPERIERYKKETRRHVLPLARATDPWFFDEIAALCKPVLPTL